MPQPISKKVTLALLVLLSLAAALIAFFTPGFAFDNTLVYQAF